MGGICPPLPTPAERPRGLTLAPRLRRPYLRVEEADMAQMQTYGWDTYGRGTYGSGASDYFSRRAALERLEWLAQLLDTALVIPGSNFRFGADAIIGLVPGIGDAITTAISAYIVYEARRL